MTVVTYEPARRPNGSWGVKRSDGETVFGSYDTEAEARACAEGATWVRERMEADQ